MPKTRICIAFFILLCLIFTGLASAAQHGKAPAKKIGILLVAFGSSKASAQISFENIEKKVKATYPDFTVKWAYTSHIIRKKLAKQGVILDSPEIALAKMADDGFTNVAVQSLHTIAGAEYDDLNQVVSSYKAMGIFDSVALGAPLLGNQDDLARTVGALLDIIPTERKEGEAVVFMGHGTYHPANAFYSALNFQLQLKDPNVFVGTVEGFPELDVIMDVLTKAQIKKVYLMPFMSVAGDHAKNDMAGDEPDSWKSSLEKSGFEVTVILKGTAEYDQFVQIWVDHLAAPLGQF